MDKFEFKESGETIFTDQQAAAAVCCRSYSPARQSVRILKGLGVR